MDIRVLQKDGKEGKTVQLSGVTSRRVSHNLLHQIVVADRTNRRVSRAHTKDRAERRGGGKKPWRQKGTGRARHGSSRSPLWRKGGITFGPRAARQYSARVPRGMRAVALRDALVTKIEQNEFLLLESLPSTTGKTKEIVAFLKEMNLPARVLLLVSGDKEVRALFLRATRNMPLVTVKDPTGVSVEDLLTYERVLATEDGLSLLKKRARLEVAS